MPPRRTLLFVLALAGTGVAARLAAYQLGVATEPWEPLFGDGAREVLRSSFSRALPIPDAALGAASYAAEAALALVGGSDRERTAPVVPLASGALAALMALGGAALALVQAFVVHAFCTLCLASAVLSLAVAAIAIPEALRAARVVARARRGGVGLAQALHGTGA